MEAVSDLLVPVELDTEKERSRIRDNQRRSRARKKEYLLEIEQKLRQCQFQGVEASAEVQQAARQVANENHKLRQLLHTLGLVDKQIEQYIQTGKLDPSSRNVSHVIHESNNVVPGQAATTLERLMIPRRPPFLEDHKPFVPASRPASTDRTLMYEPASDSSVEGYGPSAEDVQQPHGLTSASPTNLGPRQAYPLPGNVPSHGYAGHQFERENAEWTNTQHNQANHRLPLNPPEYVANQQFDYRPPFPGENPSTSPLPSTCCELPAAPYVVYHSTHHQPPAFVASQLASGVSNDSGPALVVDTGPSVEERPPPQTGNSDGYAWAPMTHLNRSHFDRRHG